MMMMMMREGHEGGLWPNNVHRELCYNLSREPVVDGPINGKFLQTVSEVKQISPCTIQWWCGRTKLSINPNKTVVIPFTRKRTLKGL
jgi:hypothetical protein